jgi:hypothetical protein
VADQEANKTWAGTPAWPIGLSLATTIVACRSLADGKSWPASEQPELKKALENAPVLKTESQGEPA